MGKCPDCGAWDALESHRPDPASKKDPQAGLVAAWASAQEGNGSTALTTTSPPAAPASHVDPSHDSAVRLPTTIHEFDRVLGGGIVAGSAVLVGGAPGIGKSTLLLQAAHALAHRDIRTLYVSSEESISQVRLRLERITADLHEPRSTNGSTKNAATAQLSDELYLLSDTNLARIVEQIRKVKPSVVVIDSIQMIYKGDLDAPPGSMTQLRRCCADLVTIAKVAGIAIVMVGHLTKADRLAGPRLLEHLVDAVISFEGDRYHAHRVVRAIKNRFGNTLEVGLFEMTGSGLVPAPEGSVAIDLAASARAGSVFCPVIHGSRTILVEVQALTATGFLGAAKRKCSGLDPNRLAMLIAVLEQHAGMRLADRDIFASSVGGLRVVEPASDLALLLAIAGAQLKRGLAPGTAVAGEVGLGGEVRPVASLESRIMEASKLGCKRFIIPAMKELPNSRGPAAKLELIPVRSIAHAIEQLG